MSTLAPASSSHATVTLERLPLEQLPEPRLESAPTPRYHELDALRAFAMLLGIAWHAAVLADVLPETDNGVSNFVVSFFVKTAHAFRLPVFFVMAGFFAALVVARSGARAFATQRLKRIGIPLVVGVAVLVPMINALTVWSSYAIWGGPHASITARDLLVMQPHHLWFLEYLLVFYALVLGGRAAAPRLRRTALARARVFRFLATSRLRLVALVPLLAFVWGNDALWLHRGIDTTFVPSPGGVLYYGAFFLFGYALYARRELIPAVRADHRAYTLLALLAAVAITQTHGYVESLAIVTVAWSATFALMGWFAIWFDKPNARVRYVADSAYWLYLAHFPILALLYLELTRYGVPLPIKLIGAPLVVVGGLLLVYEHAIRYTAIGRVLHGRR